MYFLFLFYINPQHTSTGEGEPGTRSQLKIVICTEPLQKPLTVTMMANGQIVDNASQKCVSIDGLARESGKGVMRKGCSGCSGCYKWW